MLKHVAVLTVLLLLSAAQASAESYGMADLESLVKSKDFREAYGHLKDIPPTKRDAAWKKVALEAVIGTSEAMKDADCQEKWFFLKEAPTEFGFLSDETGWKAKTVDAGVCHVKNGRFSRQEQVQELADVLIALDAEAIYRLTQETHFNDYRCLFEKHSLKNAARYKNDSKVREYFKRNFDSPCYRMEAAETVKLKVELARALGIDADLVKAGHEKLAAALTEMLTGEFNNSDKGEQALRSLERLGAKPDEVQAATFWLAQFLVAVNTHERAVPALQKVSPAALKKAQQKILSVKPERTYWFTGQGWDENGEPELRQKLAGDLMTTVQKECDALLADGQAKVTSMDEYTCAHVLGERTKPEAPKKPRK